MTSFSLVPSNGSLKVYNNRKTKYYYWPVERKVNVVKSITSHQEKNVNEDKVVKRLEEKLNRQFIIRILRKTYRLCRRL
jgi:hypothetical protein